VKKGIRHDIILKTAQILSFSPSF